jgi:hypothetical protein
VRGETASDCTSTMRMEKLGSAKLMLGMGKPVLLIGLACSQLRS